MGMNALLIGRQEFRGKLNGELRADRTVIADEQKRIL
jgi:hypothetical protein